MKLLRKIFIKLGLIRLGFVAISVAVMYLTLRPSPDLAEIFWIPDWLGNWADKNGNVRTAVPFFIPSMLWGLISRRKKLPVHLSGYAAIWLFLIITESLQIFLPQRNMDIGDIGWGSFGMALGGLVGIGMLVISQRRQEKKAQRNLTPKSTK